MNKEKTSDVSREAASVIETIASLKKTSEKERRPSGDSVDLIAIVDKLSRNRNRVAN